MGSQAVLHSAEVHVHNAEVDCLRSPGPDKQGQSNTIFLFSYHISVYMG